LNRKPNGRSGEVRKDQQKGGNQPRCESRCESLLQRKKYLTRELRTMPARAALVTSHGEIVSMSPP
jgi:hypothetical protein